MVRRSANFAESLECYKDEDHDDDDDDLMKNDLLNMSGHRNV